MTIQQFIEAAIEGKYHISGMPFENDDNKIISTKIENEGTILLINYEWNNEGTIQYPVTTIPINKELINEMVLNPKAWEAVGKVKGWGETVGESQGTPPLKIIMGRYDRASLGGFIWSLPQYHMHKMIDELCAGRTIEEYIATL